MGDGQHSQPLVRILTLLHGGVTSTAMRNDLDAFPTDTMSCKQVCLASASGFTRQELHRLQVIK